MNILRRLVLLGVLFATGCSQEIASQEESLISDDDQVSIVADTEACDPEAFSCSSDESVEVCEAGKLRSYSCEELCAFVGLESLGCFDDDCQCGAVRAGDAL